MSAANQTLLRDAIANCATQLKNLTSSPHPSYSVDGVSYSWGEHFNNLMKAMQDMTVQLQMEDGPFEVTQLPGTNGTYTNTGR